LIASPEPQAAGGDGATLPDRIAGATADRIAERTLVRFLGAVVLLVLAAGIATALRHHRGGGGYDIGTVSGPPASPGTPSTEALTASLGPATGADVAAYVAVRRQALAELRGPLVAIVSFDRYARSGDASRFLEPYGPVRAWLVAAPGGLPRAVTGNLAAWAAGERAEAARESDAIRSLLPTVANPRLPSYDAEFAAFYTNELRRFAVLVSADASSAVVFAAVIESTADRLRALAGRSGVRLVDPVGTVVPDPAVVRGLRPEEQVRAGYPDTRPVS